VVPVIKSPFGLGKNMSRERHRRGWVEETGKRAAKWKGHYFVYERKLDGEETRKHRAPILGLKAEMKKWEAEKRLQESSTRRQQEQRFIRRPSILSLGSGPNVIGP